MEKSRLKIYKEVLNKYDKEIDNKEKKEGLKCVCQRGCDCCCYQVIIISDFEKEVLKEFLNSLSFMERKEYWIKTRKTVAQLIHYGLTPETIRPDLSLERQRKIQEKYFSIHEQCIFLTDFKDCLVHQSLRPVACMTYRNYGNAEDCKNSPFAEKTITHNEIEWELRKELFERTGGPFDGFHILPFAILDILKNKRLLYEPLKLPFDEYNPNKKKK